LREYVPDLFIIDNEIVRIVREVVLHKLSSRFARHAPRRRQGGVADPSPRSPWRWPEPVN